VRDLRYFVILALLAGSPMACTPSAQRQADDSAAITAALEVYLPRLGQVYVDGEIEALRPYAAEKEMARIQALVQNLVDQGRYLEPVFKNVTIESIRTWNNSNAFVTTLEVWDVHMHALGSGQVLAEDRDKDYRVQYQLKRDASGWRVLFRAIKE
jgi:ARC6-like, IMS domain